MRVQKIQQITNRIAKKWGWKNARPVINKRKNDWGKTYIEVRTELTSWAGGNELILEIERATNYYGENQGGCIYHFYKEL